MGQSLCILESFYDVYFMCVQELLRLDPEVTDDVRNSAILSFATLIQKTCSRQCKGDTLDRYAKLYLDRFTGSYLSYNINILENTT